MLLRVTKEGQQRSHANNHKFNPCHGSWPNLDGHSSPSNNIKSWDDAMAIQRHYIC